MSRYTPARRASSATHAFGWSGPLRTEATCVDCGLPIPYGIYVRVWFDGRLAAGEWHRDCYRQERKAQE